VRLLCTIAVLVVLQAIAVPAARAERPCPPRPCDPKQDGTKCQAKADWIVEGMVTSVRDRYGSDCQTWGDRKECESPVWLGADIGLDDVRPVKLPPRSILSGAIRFDFGYLTVSPGNRCWQAARMSPDIIPKRVRLYGMDKYDRLPTPLEGDTPIQSSLGYFAYERID
jgi:hypothetical protein